ncbi:endonuclease MutS2 [Clostridium sp. 19966]|uniref:endonuclease MutS2 n=1 Tax=Clostridium sp. 19966 TaxID=2768166 RepID=UPI0028DE8924|nr:endonuclease MutS2 [Clostridium sp. 19966]MDT8716907.1 endonuclease MutS2 [Clostridium sp. 19966]
MNNKTIELLEYDRIKEILKGYSISELGKAMIDKLQPQVDIKVIENCMNETSEARAIVNISSSVPIHSLKGVSNITHKLGKGSVLTPEELDIIARLLWESKKLKIFMQDKEEEAPTISQYAKSMYELEEVRDEIERCIAYGRVEDKASSKLSKIRKKIAILEERIKSKLESVLKNEKYKAYIQDALVSQRDGRYVIPIKSEYRKNIEGDVHDKSSSGSTVFVEPAEVKKAQDELNICKIEEEKEVYVILSTLTNMVESSERELNINIQAMVYYDFLFAKGRFSKSIDGREVKLNTKNYINIIKGRHPLIGGKAVPLDFQVGEAYNSVVITGPNTGGKTVALKTVGLLTMMAQSGLHVPVEKGSEFAIFADVLVDIGDGQSIEQNLSTFSSHIKNIINILNSADENTLVIVDEIGSGTDPGEGMGLAVSILKELYNKGAIILATTHYSEIKEFANNEAGFINGSMEFDINTLKPLYRLNIGKAGESNAFLIALRLGMDSKIIEKAHEITYKQKKDYSKYKWEEKPQPAASNQEFHQQQVEKFKKAEKKNILMEKQNKKDKFKLGDSVYISFMKRTGIICEMENSKGEYGVMVMKKKLKINKKRLSLYISNDELYPEDYDFDIVFESKENRKNKHILEKRHEEGVEVVIKKGI